MSLLSTVVMVLFAYRVAQMWIDTESDYRVSQLPDAEQFAFMMKMCSGGSFFVLFEFILFAVPFEFGETWFSFRRKRYQPRIKPVVKWLSVVFTITLHLTLMVQLADVWVHKTLESTTLTIADHLGTPTHNHSRVLRSACYEGENASSSVGLNGVRDTSCVFGSDGFLFDPIETFATVTNTSDVNTIHFE